MLREYQRQILVEQVRLWKLGRRRLLIVAPTGSGKTTVAVENISRSRANGYRSIFIAHRAELIEQASQRLGDIPHGIVKAGHPERLHLDVQVASVQTLMARPHLLAQLAAPRLLLYVDEAHRVAGDSYRRVLEAFPRAFVAGLSATPYRADGAGLSEFFDAIVEVTTPAKLFEEGFLVEPQIAEAREPDLRGVRVERGDFAPGELERRCAALIGEIVPTWKRLAAGLCTIVFAVSRAHSKQIAEAFRAAGVPAEHIDGDAQYTPPERRRAVLEDLAAGRVRVVCNVDLLTEGWDGQSYARPGAPYVPLSCLVAARPTTSMGLWFQQLGRLTRPGKDLAIVLDHAGNTKRHGHLRNHHGFTLAGSIQGEAIKGRRRPAFRRCSRCAALWPASAERCSCGGELGTPRILDPKEGEIELAPAPAAGPRKLTPAEKEELFERFLREALAAGHNPGRAAHRFHGVVGEWPSTQNKSKAYKNLGVKP